jgi:type II secretion system protein N
MPPEIKTARWKLVVGYTAFALSSFIFFLYLTFPYEAVRDRVTQEAAAAGWDVQIGSLGPGLFGVTATRVQLSRLSAGQAAGPEGADAAAAAAGSPLILASVAARPALFPPGIACRANAFGGIISGSVGGLGDLNLGLTLDRLDPSDGSLKAATGLDAAGLVNGTVSFSVPRDGAGYDLSKATGAVALGISQGLIKGGTVTVPMYGQPTPMELPRIALGDVEARLKFDQGKGTLEQLRAKSDDLEVNGSGTVNLAKRPDYSELNLELKIKTEEEFRKRLGMIAMGLSALPADKDDPQFRVASVTGFLGRPNFTPGSRR